LAGGLAERIREQLAGDPNVGEIRMFGGICFTLNGNMLVGTMKSGDMLVRVGEKQAPQGLAMPGAIPMRHNGRNMKGFIIVSRDSLSDEALSRWIALATAYVGALPPKERKPGRRTAKS
jgi:TfoX/Sxy family transcriptional regulator of competence genes